VKTGLLCTDAIARSITGRLLTSELPNIVVDPIEFGGLGTEEARDAVKSELLPRATIVSASIEEASSIVGIPVRNAMGMKGCAKLLKQMGAGHVVVTGGEFEEGEIVDYLFDGTEYMDMPSEKVDAESLRGMGSTFASAIAAGLAHGRAAEESVAVAKMFVTDSANDGLEMRDGSHTANQLHAWWAAGGDRGYGA
jgi:hydroxymethylpyrimidine kinase/phosphomethylpyrimidine kinase